MLAKLAVSWAIGFAVATVIAINSIGQLAANDGCVRFDTPSNVMACDVTPPEMLFENPDQRLIQLIIPISTRIGCPQNEPVMQMQIEIKSVGGNSLIIDYAPRTSLFTNIEGPIAVESRKETNVSLGIDASGSIADSVKLNAKAGTGQTNGYSENYQKIPDQQLLLASGTLERGRGVYFKFNQSPQTTLEGGHELSITIRVPTSWRGGMMRIDCNATGSRSGLFGHKDDVKAGNASFVIATWLKGDLEAQSIVDRYADIESRFRQGASSWQRHQNSKSTDDPIGQFFGGKPSPLPENWVDQFMLYDSRSISSKIRPHLSRDLQRAADQYLASRTNVLQLGR